MVLKVRFLDVCDRMGYQREPVVELLHIFSLAAPGEVGVEGRKTDEFDVSLWSRWA